MNRVSVIGAGTMGNGIAQFFAQTGHQVSLVDVSQDALDNALKTIEKNLDRMIKKEKIAEDDKSKTLSNISTDTSVESGAKNAEFVVEAAVEDSNFKLDIFRDLDKTCADEVILASNTSSISITQIGSVTNRPDKVIGMHFMNPVPVMQLVEVIRGYATSDEVTNQVMTLAKELGKTPVEVNDYPGFAANRILMPMINEAIESLYHGVAGVEEIDTVMKLGMAHPMGPLQFADFIGVDVCLSILNVMQNGLGNPKYAPCPLLVNMVTAGHRGVKTGQGFYDYSEGTKNPKIAKQFR
ncbi:MAG: 3-hydroxybutyryl-CoA dehydrogenase [Bacteroidetes bacterium SW_11_45_7]|nr:MAG: 3-hydroxybutyryl-CoA dehydrogenase [Bacteroidetes bacterium SW_11_45_7]